MLHHSFKSPIPPAALAMASLRACLKRTVLVGTVVALSSACGTPTVPHGKTPVTATMDDHFTAVVALKQAIIRGDLFTAKSRAKKLDEELTLDPSHPRHWQRSIAESKEAIDGVVTATELVDAARHTARAAAACGACHARIGVQAAGPIAMLKNKPTSGDDYMRRHRTATENLWIGLIGPSNAAWTAGAAALNHIGSFPGTVGRSQGYRERAEHLERLGRWAVQAGERKTRTAVYGQLLASCASCHELFSKTN